MAKEKSGKLIGFEFKWQKNKFKKPLEFLNAYPNSSVQLINKDCFFRLCFIGFFSTIYLNLMKKILILGAVQPRQDLP